VTRTTAGGRASLNAPYIRADSWDVVFYHHDRQSGLQAAVIAVIVFHWGCRSGLLADIVFR
jgi:hypothetical protein